MLVNLHPDITDISKIADFAEIQNYLTANNFRVEINKNIESLKSFLEKLPQTDYPFSYDRAFRPENVISKNYFCLLLYSEETLIGTYAAVSLPIIECLSSRIFTNIEKISKPEFIKNIDDNLSWYSSLQWIHQEYRGRKLGIFLDYAKKNFIFSLFGGATNYAIFNENLVDYHLTQLNYLHEEFLFTINDDSLGLINDYSEKNYHMCYIDKPNWYEVKDEIFYKNV